MGTRGLTVIVKDNQIKLSNYGQWDSYFDYTGIKFLEFCKENLNEERKIKNFSEKVDLLQDITNDTEFANKIDKLLEMFQSEKTYFLGINELFPQFSRDTGVKILDIINNLRTFDFRDKKYPIFVDLDVCGIEYINVIDLDKQKVYMLRDTYIKGFKSLKVNKVIEETFIKRGFECYLSYKLDKIPSIETAKKQYEKTVIKDEETEEIPF